MQQEKKYEWVVDTTGEVQLRSQAADVDQHGEKQLAIADHALFVPAQMTAQIECNQAYHHGQHLEQGQLNIQPPSGDHHGGNLPPNSQPAQVDQMKHVLVPGFVAHIRLIKGARTLPNGNNVGINRHAVYTLLLLDFGLKQWP